MRVAREGARGVEGEEGAGCEERNDEQKVDRCVRRRYNAFAVASLQPYAPPVLYN